MKIAEEFLDDSEFSIQIPKDTLYHKALFNILYTEAGFSHMKYENFTGECYIKKDVLYNWKNLQNNEDVSISLLNHNKYYCLSKG